MQVTARAEADPLHQRHLGGGRRIAGLGDDLVAGLAADPHRLGTHDADLLDAGRGGEQSAGEARPVIGRRHLAGRNGDQHEGLVVDAHRVFGSVGQERGAVA